MADRDFEISGTTLWRYSGKSRTVIIPKGITVIDNNAFRGCKGIETVEFPDSVISIGDSAFEECSLSFVQLSANLKTIGKRAFYKCENLKNITFPAGLEYIKESAFDLCPLSTVYIPTNVKRIGKTAFANCDLSRIMVAGGRNTVVENGAFARFWINNGFCKICGEDEFEANKCFRCNRI